MATPAELARSILDGITFSGLWAAATAGALLLAAEATLGPPGGTPRLDAAWALCVLGTFVVYSIDRLRDVERDAANSPLRSAYVSRHRVALVIATGLGAVACLLPARLMPARVWALCAVVLAFGLLHRRLKDHPRAALVYVTLAWLGIVVGLPLLLLPMDRIDTGRVLVTSGVFVLAIAANVLASELRGGHFDRTSAEDLALARRLAALACVIPLFVASLRPLAVLGGAVWLSIVFFRPGERYGMLVLDGALLTGALVARAILTG